MNQQMCGRYCAAMVILAIVVASRLKVVNSQDDNSESYDNYKLYKIHPNDEQQLEILHNLSMTSDDIDFWKLSRSLSSESDAMVSPQSQSYFESMLHRNSIPFNLTMDDVGQVLRSEDFIPQTRASRNFQFDSYHRLNEMYEYLDEWAQKYPTLVTVETVGTSYERRSIKIIKISKAGANAKKSILIDAGIHAREWIGPATAMYIIYQLLENSQENGKLLDSFDWTIMPVVNPDGFEYSHTTRRLWRKTRKPYGVCRGADINRNFDYHWGEVGAGATGCSDTYKGDQAFSERESRILRDLMNSMKGSCVLYLTLHSYGNYLLYPWGYTSQLPNNWKEIDAVATAGARAIQRATGTKYKVGSSTNVLYAAAGGSDDYALGKVGIPNAITMELPGGGTYGFNPSASKIKPIVKESWIGIKAMAMKLSQKF